MSRKKTQHPTEGHNVKVTNQQRKRFKELHDPKFENMRCASKRQEIELVMGMCSLKVPIQTWRGKKKKAERASSFENYEWKDVKVLCLLDDASDTNDDMKRNRRNVYCWQKAGIGKKK